MAKEVDLHEVEVVRGYSVQRYGYVMLGHKKLIGSPITDGYIQVSLSRGDKLLRVLMHRLVATKFCERPAGCDYVNHKDGDRTNNHADNLEWVTKSQNQLHGAGHNNYKDDLKGKAKALHEAGYNNSEIGRLIGVTATTARAYVLY